MRPVRLLRRATGFAAVMVVFTATGALAHPFIADGASVPAASLTTMTLEMAHGCGDEADGGGDPTLEVAMEVPEEVSYIEPLDTDGYEAGIETDADGRPEVVTWTATDGGVAAPAVPMDLVVDGEEGDELLLKVFQGCEGFEYRWVGTPDEPADDPAVSLTLGPVDPDAPTPPTDEPAPPPADEGAEESIDEPVSGDAADDEASDEDEIAAASTDEREGGTALFWISIGLVLLVIIAALLAVQNRRRANPRSESTV
ncbi:DUF1775 domain-containing protein [Nitriliruptoraceae bacterium ZYF776]|nr:DUF1775 domain-containing protein [Profundirhabdus halotolerans]